MKRITKYLTEYQTPKRRLAALIGIPEFWLYVWLNPKTYNRKTFPSRYLQAIADFERIKFMAARDLYLSRLNEESAA